MLTWFYGIKPWEIDLLTYAEIDAYRQWLTQQLSDGEEGS